MRCSFGGGQRRHRQKTVLAQHGLARVVHRGCLKNEHEVSSLFGLRRSCHVAGGSETSSLDLPASAKLFLHPPVAQPRRRPHPLTLLYLALLRSLSSISESSLHYTLSVFIALYLAGCSAGQSRACIPSIPNCQDSFSVVSTLKNSLCITC